MAKGQLYPSESRAFADPRTGARIRQVTGHPSIQHQPFYYLPAYDDAMRRLVFISHRTGRAEVFAEVRETGELIQLTEHAGLAEWSVHPSHDGSYVYFTAGAGAWRVDTGTLEEEQLADFGDAEMRERGMVGAAMGTTALSRDDRRWAIPVKAGPVSRLVLVDVREKRYSVILERDTLGHPEFHPDDPELLRYAGPFHSRMWVIRIDGTEHRLAYVRDLARKEWIVHETWRPGTKELLAANWPHGMIGVDLATNRVRKVCAFNAWHPAMRRDGARMVADTNFPDRGLQIFDPRDGAGLPRTLCFPGASSIGAHWNTDHCPYDDGVKNPFAPQHTHPHPNFSPDGKYVVYTSDCSGCAQVYEVEVPAGF